jgi:LysM repeat protein
MNNYSYPCGNYHVIKTGDTLYKLSQIYNVSVDAIIEANPGINPNMLMIGQIICIPIAPKEECPNGTMPYIIKEGDTLYLIAKKNNIPLSLLIKANPNINPNNLIIGEILCIPEYWITYESKLYKVSFKYPSEWEEIIEDYYEGPSGYFVVSAINSNLSLDEVCKEEAYQDLKPYGSNPIIKNIKVNDEEGCLIIPSSDQIREMDNQAALIVKYPKPIKINDIEYNYAIIFVEKSYIQIIANSFKFM